MDRLNYQRFLILTFFVSVFLLAVCNIEDTDAWQHLSFGRLIWELKGLPATEPFQYTMTGQAFYYTSWLFALIYYLAYLTFDVYGVILLKATTVTVAFYILFRDSLLHYKNHITTIIIMTVVVLISRHRFVERPDTFLMVFLPFTIFSLNAFVYENKKYLYVLPFIHLLWANSHSSINLMLIPFLSFIAGGLLQQYLNKKGMRFSNTPSASQLKLILVIFTISFAVSLLNPNFIEQYTWGAKILATPWFKQWITEALAPTWKTNKWPYIIVVAVAVSFILNWLVAYRSREKEFAPLIHFIMAIPFIILAFTAVRFIFLLAFIAGPVLARNLSASLYNVKWGNIFLRRSASLMAAVWIVVFAPLTILNIKPFGDIGKTFGFGIDYKMTPEGALMYMDRKDIVGRVFNTFDWGSYIIWRDFPKRTIFIDPRGYLPPDLLGKIVLALYKPSVLDDLEGRYGFEAILTKYPAVTSNTMGTGRDDMLSNPKWALVYWDDTALLYLKRGGRYDLIIKEDEYSFVKPSDGIDRLKLLDQYYCSSLIRELKRNIESTRSSIGYAFLGFVYNETGRYKEAIDAYSHVKDLSLRKMSLNGTAYAHDKLGSFDEAIGDYKKSLSIKGDATVLYKLGTVYIKKGNNKAAIRYLGKALDIDKNLADAYPPLIDIYRKIGKEAQIHKLTEMYEEAKFAMKGDSHFKKGLEAYIGKNYYIAIEEFEQSIKAMPLDPAPYSNLGFVYFDTGMFDKALEYQEKAIKIDPDLANAHYGLALIYKRRGDTEKAKRHFAEYLRIEPGGYYSRKAKEQIEAI